MLIKARQAKLPPAQGPKNIITMDQIRTKTEHSKKAMLKLHQKPGLDTRSRYLASIESLIAIGDDHGLHLIFDLALDEGIELVDIHETMLQACIFCGFPRTINSFTILGKCLGKRGDSCNVNTTPSLDDSSPSEMDLKGLRLFREIYQHIHFDVLQSLREGHPELPGWILRDVYGKILSRPALDPRTRELAAIAALTVMEVYPQLLSHIKGGLNLGALRDEVKEVILQMEAFVPKTVVRKALRILNLGTVNHDISALPKRFKKIGS